MVRILRSHQRLLAIAILLSGALLLLHAWIGTPNGHSYRHNLPWFDAFRAAFWSGDLYPRFLPDLWFGFGGADFYFYGPLPFWFASVVGTVSCPGCEAGQAFSIAGAWMLALSGISFFFFARRFFSPVWASIGAIIYVLLPYHYVIDWFTRQAVGEVAVYMFLPLIALASIRLIEEKRGGFLLTFSIAGTILSHLPSALIVLHVLPIIVLLHAKHAKLPKGAFAACLLRFGAWGGLGVLLTAIYWLPAVSLLSSVSPSVLYSDYSIAKNWLFLDGRPEPSRSVSMFVKSCLALALATSASAAFLIRRNSDAAFLKHWILVPCLLTAFLTSAFSAPIWDVWILNKIQFPWRFLIITDLSIALGCAVIMKRFHDGIRHGSIREPLVMASFSGLVLCAVFANTIPAAIEAAHEGQALEGSFRATGAPEYLPAGVLRPALAETTANAPKNISGAERYGLFFDAFESSYRRAQAAMESDTKFATLQPLTQGRYALSVDLSRAGTVRLPIAYWSFWQARHVNGQAILVEQDTQQGLIQLSLPQGRSEVVLYLVQTTPEKIGSFLSSFSLFIILIGCVRSRRSILVTRKKSFATIMG